MDAFFIEGVEQDALDGLFVSDVIEDLVDEQLPFPVGFTGVDDGVDVGTCNEALNDVELFFTGRTDEELPLRRNDGQILSIPAFIFGIVVLRLGLLQDVAVSPGDDTAAGTDTAVSPLMRLRQALGQFPGHTRFFGNKKFHRASLFLQ